MAEKAYSQGGRKYSDVEKAQIKKEFLEHLVETGGNRKLSAEKVRVSTKTMYSWRREDTIFAEEWDICEEMGVDSLEDEAVRRGHDGVEEDIYYKGEIVGQKTNYSDAVLMFLLKGKRRERYGDSKHVTLEGGDKPLKTESTITASIKGKLDEILS